MEFKSAEESERGMITNKDSAVDNQELEAHEDEVPATEDKEFGIIDESSMSCFLYNVPGKLSWSKGSTSSLDVFWSSGHGSDSGRTRTLLPSLTETLPDDKREAIEERIKTALGLFKTWSFYTTLLQFWAPIFVGNQIFLSTAELSFGLKYCFDGNKGPCLYRKHCLQHKYIADWDERNEDHFGPPGRVFHRGLPEYNPRVRDYSIKEYPLRDLALHCRATTYLGLPVFESIRQRCVCVLEVLTFDGPGWNCISCLQEASLALETVGLKLMDIPLPSLEHWDANRAEKEIEAGLKMVCNAHNIPLAQTWVAKDIVRAQETIFSVLKNLTSTIGKEYYSFSEASIRSGLRAGKGVVGKAYSSFTSCFCKDIARLSTNDYSLALDARKVNLTSCFAICLRSSYTGYSVYIVEFFLPTSQTTCKEPWIFLESLLATIKCNFQSFKIASGLELGKELSVEVIKLPGDEELDSFKIHQTTKSPPTLGYSPNGKIFPPNEGQNIELHSSCQQLELGVAAVTNAINNVFLEQSTVALPLFKEVPPNEGHMMQLDTSCCSLSLDISLHNGEKNVYGPKQSGSIVTSIEKGRIVKTSDWGKKITSEVLEQHVGKKLEDVANILGVSRSTLKRICRKNNISRWPSYKRGKVKHSLFIVDAKKHIAEERFRDHLYSGSTAEEGTTSNAYPISQVIRMQNESSMTIKAKYGADIIKFEISISSTMMELVDEVIKRFKLQADTFKAKYLDEDNDLILLACDEDLQKYMRSMRSLGRVVGHIVIEPIIEKSVLLSCW